MPQDIADGTAALTGLHSRIAAALARIEGAAAALPQPGSADETTKLREETNILAAKIARLEEALETESVAVEQLRTHNQTLKRAKEEAQARIAELEAALAAAQASQAEDRAELDSILAALDPLMTEHANA